MYIFHLIENGFHFFFTDNVNILPSRLLLKTENQRRRNELDK
jgi:hypothetical protein